jgi:dihydroflavonol-4-reductase
MITIMPGENRLVQRVNVEGTHNMLQAAQRAGVRRFLYTSSIHAIQRAQHGTLIDEKLPYDPYNPYGAYDRSKAQASMLVQAAARQGLNAVIACPTGVIGPYDYRRSEMGELIRECAQGVPQLYVDGAYDFVDVRDVAEGLVRVSRFGRPGESYILSGQQITVPRLLSYIQAITGKRLLRLKIPMQVARTFARFTPLYYRLVQQEPRFTHYSLEVLASNSVISHAKARLEVGYNPRPLYDSLVDTVQWFTANRHQVKKPTRA